MVLGLIAVANTAASERLADTLPGCQGPVEVIAIQPLGGLQPSRSGSGGPLYRVKFRQCGALYQVVVEASGNTDPGPPLELKPMLF
jgi:hypothetical protein